MVSYYRFMPLEREGIDSIPSFSNQDEQYCYDNHSVFEILLGKEKAIFNHSGNMRFRAIVNHNAHKYIGAITKAAKTKLVNKIYADMKRAGFCFLKRENSTWKRLHNNAARVKFSHALRDRVRELQRKSKRQEKYSGNMYPMIMSMASVVKKNQVLLQNATKTPSLIANGLTHQCNGNYLSDKTAATCTDFQKTASPDTALVNLVGSHPDHITKQWTAAKRQFCHGDMNAAPPPRTIVGRMDASHACSEDTLFGGLANEIGDAQLESSFSPPAITQSVPVKYVTFTEGQFGEDPLQDYSPRYGGISTIKETRKRSLSIGSLSLNCNELGLSSDMKNSSFSLCASGDKGAYAARRSSVYESSLGDNEDQFHSDVDECLSMFSFSEGTVSSRHL